MGDLIRSAIIYAAVIGLLVGGFKLYKNSTTVEIDPTDRSMSSILYPYGTYKVDTTLKRIEQLKPENVVAYWVTDQPQKARVARVLAIAGQRIAVEQGAIKVDGQDSKFTVDNKNWSFPEIRVPRGCAYVLHDVPSYGRDSVQLGPLPFSQIVGKLD